MTAFQAFGLCFLATMFFGSIGLGLYLRRRDRLSDLAPPPTRPPEKTEPLGQILSTNDVRRKFRSKKIQDAAVVHGRLQTVSTPAEALAMAQVLDRYYAEVERLARGYHGLAVAEGEEAARKWLHQQTGQDKST